MSADANTDSETKDARGSNMLPVKIYFGVYAVLLILYIVHGLTSGVTMEPLAWVKKAFPNYARGDFKSINADASGIRLWSRLAFAAPDGTQVSKDARAPISPHVARLLARTIAAEAKKNTPPEQRQVRQIQFYSDSPLAQIPWPALLNVYNLLGLFGAAYIFGKGPLLNMLDDNARQTREMLDEAREAKAAAEELKRKYEELLAEVEAEKERLGAAAKTELQEERENILNLASHEANGILAAVKAGIEAEVAAARENLRARVAEQAILHARKIVAKHTEKKDHEAAFELFVENLSEVKLDD